jgi:hypothetical protein
VANGCSRAPQQLNHLHWGRYTQIMNPRHGCLMLISRPLEDARRPELTAKLPMQQRWELKQALKQLHKIYVTYVADDADKFFYARCRADKINALCRVTHSSKCCTALFYLSRALDLK